MIQLENIEKFYFVGIGGIGMSALARYFSTAGKKVSGYDKTPSDITKALLDEGIEVHFEDETMLIDTSFKKEVTLVVYTPAIPVENQILNYFKSEGYTIVKRAELLGEITKSTKCLAVAGTHGKTTTSAILGHLLAFAQEEVTAFLGGVSENYNSNLIQRGKKVTVVEADEFDRSFLKLHPFIAGITSMDADHLDIYGDEKTIAEAFKAFAALVPKNGFLLHKKGLPLNGKTVGIEDESDFEAQNVRIENGAYVFDFKTPNSTIYNLTLNLPGRHNLFNTTLALGMAVCLGSPTHILPEALLTFKGVKRRFSYKIKTDNLVLIDDYAHHPEEINAVHQAAREMYPQKEILAVFQPHLFSRTRDFAAGFAKSLSQFDYVLLLEIYPAREKPIAGIDSKWLLKKVENQNKKLVSKDQLSAEIKKINAPVNVMLGAGDIGEEVSIVVKNLGYEN
ncbi:MAG: UDP-N-acetylmuramate--L-alanine ligase [Flavobacteriaceae bacterium]|nr:UDP-N-acetylmuramate--L-alanine ligase [Flavobacteriaceae bacterium]